jgi:hypothetical protein
MLAHRKVFPALSDTSDNVSRKFPAVAPLIMLNVQDRLQIGWANFQSEGEKRGIFEAWLIHLKQADLQRIADSIPFRV